MAPAESAQKMILVRKIAESKNEEFNSMAQKDS